MTTFITRSDVTVTSSFRERGGAIRLSRSRTAVVVGASEDVRTGWARYFEALGFRTLRCADPQVMCSLLAGDVSCPLHRQAIAGRRAHSVEPVRTLQVGGLHEGGSASAPELVWASDPSDH